MKENTVDVTKDSDVLDLPYVVLRCIFGYLSDKDLHFNVKQVCRQLRGYVEDYVQIGKLKFNQTENQGAFVLDRTGFADFHAIVNLLTFLFVNTRQANLESFGI